MLELSRLEKQWTCGKHSVVSVFLRRPIDGPDIDVIGNREIIKELPENYRPKHVNSGNCHSWWGPEQGFIPPSKRTALGNGGGLLKIDYDKPAPFRMKDRGPLWRVSSPWKIGDIVTVTIDKSQPWIVVVGRLNNRVGRYDERRWEIVQHFGAAMHFIAWDWQLQRYHPAMLCERVVYDVEDLDIKKQESDPRRSIPEYGFWA